MEDAARSLRELVVPRGFVDLQSGATKEQVLTTLVRMACEAAGVPAQRVDEVSTAVRAQEAVLSSGMGGIAIPHACHEAVARDAIRVGRVRNGIDFDSLDRRPVHLVLVVLLPAGAYRRFLDLMPAILAALKSGSRRAHILSSPDADTFVARFFAPE